MKRLPYAQGQQYLCALAISNGAHPVWADEHESVDDKIALAGKLLQIALKEARNGIQE